MRVGMYIDMRNPPAWQRPWNTHYGRWLEWIEEGERRGADSVWLTEHHFFDDGYLPQCWTFAAAIAARTKKVRIGSAVALLPLHTGIETAEQLAICDLISEGRMEPGFGIGYRQPEYAAFGGDFKHRYKVFAERIHEMRQLWGEEDGAQRLVTPGPVQRPVPLWAGFNGPIGARTAGRLGVGLLSLRRELLEPYLIGLEQGGHDPSTARMAGMIECFVTDDPEKAQAEIGEHAMYRWDSYNRYMYEGTKRENSPPVPGIDAMESRMQIGTVDQLTKQIKESIEGLPVTDLFVFTDYPGMPDELVARHLELTFDQLAPRLR
jgi:alkanesulfonate monooxygenase SsuD/methylene tetrahydromethanopterin reductase-like flavin-dependent oxidoreductase (luciferase family)